MEYTTFSKEYDGLNVLFTNNPEIIRERGYENTGISSKNLLFAFVTNGDKWAACLVSNSMVKDEPALEYIVKHTLFRKLNNV